MRKKYNKKAENRIDTKRFRLQRNELRVKGKMKRFMSAPNVLIQYNRSYNIFLPKKLEKVIPLHKKKEKTIGMETDCRGGKLNNAITKSF